MKNVVGRPFAAGNTGRPKGAVGKVPKALKEAVLGAFNQVGGQDWLVKMAGEQPVAFMGMISKVLPLTLASDPDSPPTLKVIMERTFVGSDHKAQSRGD